MAKEWYILHIFSGYEKRIERAIRQLVDLGEIPAGVITEIKIPEEELTEVKDGKKKVISIVPSIDTGICSTQTRTFNKELSELDDTVVITISVDLPFAQARWCGAEGLENAIMLSDYYDNSFGKEYGVLIEEWHLLARAVLVADADNKITYVEYLDNINSDPNYEAAVAAVKSL